MSRLQVIYRQCHASQSIRAGRRRVGQIPRALEILQECSGSQFDPEVAAAMAAWVRQVATELNKPGRVTAQDLLDSQKAPVVAA